MKSEVIWGRYNAPEETEEAEENVLEAHKRRVDRAKKDESVVFELIDCLGDLMEHKDPPWADEFDHIVDGLNESLMNWLSSAYDISNSEDMKRMSAKVRSTQKRLEKASEHVNTLKGENELLKAEVESLTDQVESLNRQLIKDHGTW